MPPPTIQTAPPRHSRTAASITEQFHAVDAQHPGIFAALEQLITDRLAAGATRVGMKALFEALRWRQPDGVQGLNNNYTAL
ncbi:hypothetical protein [Streptomyces sp. NPDC088246]|uniref:hypothetical protein n=1 Tax=Streptomyces sp. NPDC088246 TaxID=3365842 RepID=UPI0038047579